MTLIAVRKDAGESDAIVRCCLILASKRCAKVSILCNDNTAIYSSKAADGCVCHLPGRFSNSNEKYPAGEIYILQRTAHSFVRQYRCNCMTNNLLSIGTEPSLQAITC